MGLAASQARFLCITARKADCEYRSTALAQEKLDISKQLSDISTQYAQSLNATKLVWQNDAVNADYGVSYGLLMTPAAVNDYNPYMITSPSGAVILNSEYAAAAKSAGISKAGGVGSQTSRDKFIAALSYGGLITDETAKSIMMYDYKVDEAKTKEAGRIVFEDIDTSTVTGKNVAWNPAAGMGAEPLDKSATSSMTLSELCTSENIGKQVVDWAKLLVDDGKVTKNEYDREVSRLNGLKASVTKGVRGISDEVVNQLKADYNNYKNKYVSEDTTKPSDYDTKCKEYESLVKQAQNIANVDKDGYLVDGAGARILDAKNNAVKQSTALENISKQISSDLDTYKTTYEASAVDIESGFNTKENSLNTGYKYSVVDNGVINHYKSEITSMTLGDVLSGNIVLVASNTNGKEFREQCMKMLDSMAAVLGYSKTDDLTGQGLNVDDASAAALEFAYSMVKNTYLKESEIQETGSRYSDKSMTDNSAYQNAVNFNRIGSDSDKKYYAVSLSNMMSAFLTYYENCLSGVNSLYVVGMSPETSSYVTDNLSYQYIGKTKDSVTDVASKSADFYDQLYNNILEHGWREDQAIEDSEYLEAALKDGRYSMTSLNDDGYHYQTRYNETGYMVEVSDTDAIERAEAEFTSMKAQLTYKEDSIDLKTKKLDAEISSLSTEYDTVKSLISKSIEKTFAMFQN